MEQKERIAISNVEFNCVDDFTIYWYKLTGDDECGNLYYQDFNQRHFLWYNLEDAFYQLLKDYQIDNLEDYGDLIEEKTNLYYELCEE